MAECSICMSYEVNPGYNERSETENIELCDGCYWKNKFISTNRKLNNWKELIKFLSNPYTINEFEVALKIINEKHPHSNSECNGPKLCEFSYSEAGLGILLNEVKNAILKDKETEI